MIQKDSDAMYADLHKDTYQTTLTNVKNVTSGHAKIKHADAPGRAFRSQGRVGFVTHAHVGHSSEHAHKGAVERGRKVSRFVRG